MSAAAALVRRATLFAVCCLANLAVAFGQDAESEGGSRRAILIGAERYRLAPPLRYITNDVKQIGTTLRRRGGYEVLEMSDESAPDLQPTSKNMRQQLPEWLADAGAHDDMVVYFSGHGFRGADKRLYLAPIDCDPAQPEREGIPADWLRQQLAACKARFKLLVLDACHAGNERAVGTAASVSSKDLGLEFENVTGVVTLASCQADEQSLIWEEKRQSLFSYWLRQGLGGHADSDGDGRVTIDELYDYVFENVQDVARRRFQRPQTPVRIVRSGTTGVPSVIQLGPRSLKEVLDDMAEQIATSMQLRKIDQVGVLEFTSDTRLGELLGADFGALGRYCAEELAGRLVRKSADRFSVVDQRTLDSALVAKGLALGDLATPRLKDLAVEAGGMQVVALGMLRSRMGRVVTLQCKLLQTADRKVVGTAGDTALLSESEWAMLGISATVPSESRLSDAVRPATIPGQHVFQALDAQRERPCPLLDPAFPYRVKIMVAGEERPCVFRGNDAYVPLRKDEVYEIWIENRTPSRVFLRLLVDGLNTLPEFVPTEKGLMVEATAPAGSYQPAQRVNLGDARAWMIDPQEASLVAVRGFFTTVGEEGTLRKFRVVDAPDSLAARQKFTDQLGMITAAFYGIKAERGLGTAAGEERRERTGLYQAQPVGNLLAVVHLRYASPEAIEALGRK
jgi:hypothetical protein